MQHGADANKKNRDGHTPLDLVKDGDTDVQDLLRGVFITILQNVGVLSEIDTVLPKTSAEYFIISYFIEGDAALLEAAKKGNLGRVQKLATPENINCRDTQGRNSTPLHLAGKYEKVTFSTHVTIRRFA